MRDDVVKLNQIKGYVVACTMNLDLIHKDLCVINDTYQLYKDAEFTLLENIKVLKSNGVAIAAKAYSIALNELQFVQEKLTELTKQYTNTLKEYAQTEKKQQELLIKYNEQMLICKNYKVVVPFDLTKRKKNDGEK